MNILDYIPFSRQYWGNVADIWGTVLSPNKGWGISEKIAGGPTIFTGRIPEAQAAEFGSESNGRQIDMENPKSTPNGASSSGGQQNTKNTNLNDLITQGESEAEKQAREARERAMGAIESGYGEYVNQLDQLAGLYPQWKAEDISRNVAIRNMDKKSYLF